MNDHRASRHETRRETRPADRAQRIAAIPRVVLAGTGSGCGKTTVALALLAALRRRGVRVQPFKVGPDYIDHKFHSAVSGRDSRNLDSWMLGEDAVLELFEKHGAQADLSVIEGVMGLYDGYGGTDLAGSTHHVAGLLGAPLILVIGARGMSLSVCAMIEGYMRFGGYERIGVIFNGIAGSSTYDLLRQNLRDRFGEAAVPLGYLPRDGGLSLPERHLGLSAVGSSPEERAAFDSKVDLLAQRAESGFDIEGILAFAGAEPADAAGCAPARSPGRDADQKPVCAPDPSPNASPASPSCALPRRGSPVIAVARDDAFHFYYPDNLDLLREYGAELVFFSPLTGEPPAEADGLYIGGGYPELYVGELEANRAAREGVRAMAARGVPIYAECGGLMYLSRSIETADGRRWSMCGVFDFATRMSPRLAGFGYSEASFDRDTPLGPAGTAFRTHEFHYSEIVPGTADGVETACRVRKSRRTSDGGSTVKQWREGYLTGGSPERAPNVLASYLHIHFYTEKQLAANFVRSCREYRERGKDRPAAAER